MPNTLRFGSFPGHSYFKLKFAHMYLSPQLLVCFFVLKMPDYQAYKIVLYVGEGSVVGRESRGTYNWYTIAVTMVLAGWVCEACTTGDFKHLPLLS